MSIFKIVRNLILISSLKNPTCKDLAINSCRITTRNFYVCFRIYIIICFLRILCIPSWIKFNFYIAFRNIVWCSLICLRFIDILINCYRNFYYSRPTTYSYECFYLFLTAWLIAILLLELIIENIFKLLIKFLI